jgi:hypothetical protein
MMKFKNKENILTFSHFGIHLTFEFGHLNFLQFYIPLWKKRIYS